MQEQCKRRLRRVKSDWLWPGDGLSASSAVCITLPRPESELTSASLCPPFPASTNFAKRRLERCNGGSPSFRSLPPSLLPAPAAPFLPPQPALAHKGPARTKHLANERRQSSPGSPRRTWQMMCLVEGVVSLASKKRFTFEVSRYPLSQQSISSTRARDGRCESMTAGA